MTALPPDAPRLRTGIVGAGHVGAVIGAALQRAGHDVRAISAVSNASLDRAAALLPGVPVREVPDVVSDADLLVLAVPDDALAPLITGLTAIEAWLPGQIVMHVSGRHGLAPFDPALAVPVLPLAIHPAMAFTGTHVDLDRLVGCPFVVTSAGDLRPVAEALVLEMGGHPVWIADASRPRYSAAVDHTSHLATLIGQALDLLRGAGVGDPGALLRHLAEAELDNALRHGDSALNGPVLRGDIGTVEEHLRQCAQASPDTLPTYRALALATTERAARAGRLRADDAATLRRLLAGTD